MTCCSCDRPPGPGLLSAAAAAAAAAAGAVGARWSATGQTETQRLRLFWEVVWCRTPCLLSHQPLFSTTPLFPYSQHTHTHTLSSTHTQPGCFYMRSNCWTDTDSVKGSVHPKHTKKHIFLLVLDADNCGFICPGFKLSISEISATSPVQFSF